MIFFDAEYWERQEAFRRRVVNEAGLVVARVKNPGELELLVHQALIDLSRAKESQRRHGEERGPTWAVPGLGGREVARPGLMAHLVALVLQPAAGTVAMTTGLQGAGGFGKTTLARLLVHEPAVRKHFADGGVWVTVGQDAHGADLADKVTDVCALLTGTKPPLSDPVLAGAELGRVLGERRMLLVIDDVWSLTQLEPFLIGAPAVVRMVTTRQRSVLPEATRAVRVDAMDRNEAESLLRGALPPPPADVLQGLLAATGKWPVLLALVHGALAEDMAAGRPAPAAFADLLAQLRAHGPTVLDVSDPDRRAAAVHATMTASLDRLSDEERARYEELAVFGEDVDVPVDILDRYWAHTGRLTTHQVRQLCGRLSDLSLILSYRLDPPRVRLHDVVRSYLRSKTPRPLSQLDLALIDALRIAAASAPSRSGTPWYLVPHHEEYIWAWLTIHLRSAGLTSELRGLVQDADYLVAKLALLGPAAVERDFALLNPSADDSGQDQVIAALATAIRQNGHLLAPLEPGGRCAPHWHHGCCI